MGKNIFKGAKFGSLFKLYNNQLCVLLCLANNCAGIVSETGEYFTINLDGTDIKNPKLQIVVSKYQEPIDEKKLDELAYQECNKIMTKESCFIAGYRKAMEEK